MVVSWENWFTGLPQKSIYKNSPTIHQELSLRIYNVAFPRDEPHNSHLFGCLFRIHFGDARSQQLGILPWNQRSCHDPNSVAGGLFCGTQEVVLVSSFFMERIGDGVMQKAVVSQHVRSWDDKNIQNYPS